MKSLVAEATETYRVMMDEVGEPVTLRRQIAPPPAAPSDFPARARVAGFTAAELVGGIKQGDRKVILLAEDVAESGFPAPFQTGGTDKIVVRGQPLNVTHVDDSTRRVAGALIAYEITATG